MPSSDDIQRPQEAVRVAKRYLRVERPLTGLLVLAAVTLYLGVYVLTSLLPAVGVAVLLILLARVPIFRSQGTIRLRTDADPETVGAVFSGPTPPILALQWGIADELTAGDDSGEATVTYRTSYLFGLRTAVVTLQTRTDTTPDGTHTVELALSANGTPWATYTATVSDTTEGTVVDVEYTSSRRFGLRRLPQQLVATRYRTASLTAQEYTVVARDSYFGL